MSRPLVLFDCDGTLVDSQHVIHEAMQAAFVIHGLAAPSGEAVRHVIGLRLDHAIEQLLVDGSDETVAAVTQSYKEIFLHLRQREDHDEPMFPGMRDLVVDLAGRDVMLGVVTGKSLRGLRGTLEMHDVAQCFVTLQTPDNAPGKPDPGMVLQAMAETGAAPASTLVIGDTTFDIDMARSAGVTALGVAWGYHEPEDLVRAGAHQIADDAGHLMSQLDAHLAVPSSG